MFNIIGQNRIQPPLRLYLILKQNMTNHIKFDYRVKKISVASF